MNEKTRRGVARLPGLADAPANDVCWCDEMGQAACPVHGDAEDDEDGEP